MTLCLQEPGNDEQSPAEPATDDGREKPEKRDSTKEDDKLEDEEREEENKNEDKGNTTSLPPIVS